MWRTRCQVTFKMAFTHSPHGCQRIWQRVGAAHHAIRHSLKLRLVWLFWLLALGMGVVFWAGMQKAFSVGWREAARPLLIDYVDRLTAELGTPPDPARAADLVARLPITVRIDGPEVQWQSHPSSLWREGHAERPDAQRVLQRTTADGHRIEWGLNAEAFTQRPRLAWLVLTGLLTLTALAYVMVRRWLRPLDDIGTGARRFGAGNFSQPIPVRHAHAPDELGQLAQTINTMGRDIHQMLEAKRTLLLAISHELRSPLTRARLHVELLPEDLLHIASQRQALLRDLTGMAQLIGDLLESERLSGSHQGLHQEWVDVAALIQESTTQAAMTVVLHMGADVPVRCWLDAGRLKLLLRNLLHNTLRHGHGTTTPPELGLTWEPTPTTERPTQGCLHLCVRDHGPGVAPDQLPHLAQAFYRPDSARTRESGGVGLGLYLCRLIAQAHGGRMDMHNAHPGLRVHVQLPTVAPAQATSST